ncbi:MAG: hypothetical protein ACLQUM_05915, partial [Steroidobacteraceae bacterium]
GRQDLNADAVPFSSVFAGSLVMVSAMTHPPIEIATLRSKCPLFALTFDLHQKNETIAFLCFGRAVA